MLCINRARPPWLFQIWLWAETGRSGRGRRWREPTGTYQPAKSGLTGGLPRVVERSYRPPIGWA